MDKKITGVYEKHSFEVITLDGVFIRCDLSGTAGVVDGGEVGGGSTPDD